MKTNKSTYNNSNRELTLPYKSSSISILNKYFASFFFYLLVVVLIGIISFFSYWVIKENQFEFIFIFYYIVPLLIIIGTYFMLYDYKHNFTEYIIQDDGIVVFDIFISWENIYKTFTIYSMSSLLCIDFKIGPNSHRAMISCNNKNYKIIKKIITKNATAKNPHFSSNSDVTLRDLLKRYARPSIRILNHTD